MPAPTDGTGSLPALPRDPVFLTGGTGFVGRHVATAFLEAGYPVRALVRPGRRGGPGLPPGCEAVEGDLGAAGSLARAMDGSRYLVHVAARYTLSPRERWRLYQANVAGTASLFAAARVAGIERAVLTASSAVIGQARGDRPADEEDHAGFGRHTAREHAADGYHASKVEQEIAGLAARVPTVVVLPTAPVGPGDWRPTPTGAMVLDALEGRLVGYVGGGMNVVDVADVARGHVMALERGRPGRRYILGGADLTYRDLFAMLARAAGRAAPRWRIPYPLTVAAALVDETRSRLAGRDPVIPLEGVRLARRPMYATSARAIVELGHRPSPVAPAVERAVAWYRDAGYVH